MRRAASRPFAPCLFAFAAVTSQAPGAAAQDKAAQDKAARAENTLAVFPVELWDTSGDPPKPGAAERLQRASRLLEHDAEKLQTFRADIML